MEFNVVQLEKLLSLLLTRTQADIVATIPSLSQFYIYDEFLRWVNSIQHNLSNRSEVELLHILNSNINILPLSCTVDEPEHQYRVIGVGLILSLILRPTIPNFMGIGGWISSNYEPLGVLSTQGLVRDLAIREDISGANLRQALTKYRLTYQSTLMMIVQIISALFIGWRDARLQFDKLDKDKIFIRRINPSNPVSVQYDKYHVMVTHIATFTDYDYASIRYDGQDYYKTGDKIEFNELLFDMGMLTMGEVNRAITDVYQYTSEFTTYTDDWLDNFMVYGMRNWKGMSKILTPQPLLIEQPVARVIQSKVVEPLNSHDIQYMKKLIQDYLGELSAVKNWESFESRWHSIRKHLLHLLYLQSTHYPELEQFNLRMRREIGAQLRQLLHNYLIFRFDHPNSTPTYRLVIAERMKKLGHKVM